jgi:hypothetical protein
LKLCFVSKFCFTITERKITETKFEFNVFRYFFFRSNLDESFAEVKEHEDDFDANENDDEPLQTDVGLVAQMSSNQVHELAQMRQLFVHDARTLPDGEMSTGLNGLNWGNLLLGPIFEILSVRSLHYKCVIYLN